MDKVQQKLKETKIIEFTEREIKESGKLGKGGFSKVVLGIYNQLQVAVKKLKLFDFNEYFNELKIINLLRHPNIPRLYGSYLNKEKLQLGLVTEYIKGRTLDNLGKSYFLAKLLIMIEVASAVEYLHSAKIIHRDLKPNNIMVDNYLNVKLLDLGISKMCDRSKTTTMLKGTILYMAPENFEIPQILEYSEDETSNNINGMSPRKIESKSTISNKIDIWSFGCILFEVFSGKKPWRGTMTEGEIVQNLFNQELFEIPEEEVKNIYIRHLIHLCLNYHFAYRPNAEFIKLFLLRVLYLYLLENTEDFYSDVKNIDNDLQMRYFWFKKVESNLKEFVRLQQVSNFNDDIQKFFEENFKLNGRNKEQENEPESEDLLRTVKRDETEQENDVKESYHNNLMLEVD
jgi:serine/threonine protein kinase